MNIKVKTTQYPWANDVFIVKGESDSRPRMLYTINLDTGVHVNLLKSDCFLHLSLEEQREYIKKYKKLPKI